GHLRPWPAYDDHSGAGLSRGRSNYRTRQAWRTGRPSQSRCLKVRGRPAHRFDFNSDGLRIPGAAMNRLRVYSSMSLKLMAVILLFAGGVNGGRAQEPPAKPAMDQPKTAAQQFKNIQVLKAIPAEQLMPSMQFITASLGAECDFCHVEHEMDKDDKKTKLAARKMIAMVLALNQAHFNGKLEVTCYTCHRGAAHPVGTPILSAEPGNPPEHVDDEEDEIHTGLPTPDQVLDKYLAAVGGADALNKIKTRVQKGKIDASGTQYPVEVYSEAPEKRVSITHLPPGESVTAFNG